jgi:hypothetical protein
MKAPASEVHIAHESMPMETNDPIIGGLTASTISSVRRQNGMG